MPIYLVHGNQAMKGTPTMCNTNPMTQCSACGQLFPSLSCGDSPDFDNHDCPASVAPLKGESWDDYTLRAAKFRAEYLASQPKKESKP